MANKNLASKVIGKVASKAKQFLEATPAEQVAAIKGLPGKVVGMLKGMIAPPDEEREDPRLAELMGRALVWGTTEHAAILATQARPVDWAHQWVIGQLRVVRFLHGGDSLVDKVLVDLGPGLANPVIVDYANTVRHAWLIDNLHEPEPIERGTLLKADLEQPLPLPDAGVDLVVSANALEHLSREGRLLAMREIERVLKPGGRALVAMSYFLGLDEQAIQVLEREPALTTAGNTVRARLDVAEMLAEAPGLRLLGECGRSMFPGFDGFDERDVLAIPGLLTETLDDSEWATLGAETKALGLRWAVLGMVLEKPPVGDIEEARRAVASSAAGLQDDPQLRRLLAACPHIAGKRVLVLNDDAGGFSAAIENAGGIVDSCVADLAAYSAITATRPERKCWVHDLEQPWNLSIGRRYDLVVAFDVLHRLADPEPLMSYMTQLAPQLVIDTLVLDSEEEEIAYFGADAAVRCAPSPAWIKERFERFDVDVYDLSDAVEDAADGCYAWSVQNSRTHEKEGRALRRLYLCQRRRDALSPLLVHVHMQKTGGQSVNEFLGKHSWHRMTHFYKEEPHVARWDVFQRLVNEKPEPLIFTSHVTRFSFPPLLGGRVALYFAIFRHPYDTIFSYVKYVKKNYELQVPSLKRILPPNVQEMSVEEIMKWYIRNPTPIHFAGHILPVVFLTHTTDLERTKEIVGRFFFVGVTEEMPRCMEVLKLKLKPYGFHFPNVPWVKKNVTSDVELGGYDIRTDEEFLDYAEQHLGHELAFYDWARERFEREAARFGV